MKLLHKNGEEVKVGDLVTDFRGDEAIIVHWEAPEHEGSTGRVYVRYAREVFDTLYYPSVFDLHWEKT